MSNLSCSVEFVCSVPLGKVKPRLKIKMSLSISTAGEKLTEVAMRHNTCHITH
jgi:hypothetical protein